VDVAGTQTAPFQIAHVVEQEQRVIAGAAEVAVVGRAFLVAVGRADAGIHVEDHAFRRFAIINLVDPYPGQLGKGRDVVAGGQELSLEASHLAGRCRLFGDSTTAADPSHGRIVPQAVGVVHVLVAAETTEGGLPKQARHSVLAIPADPRIDQMVALAESNLMAVRVGALRRVVCAADTYLSDNGRPRTPSDLAAHRIVAARHVIPSNDWRFASGRAVTVRPKISFSSVSAAIAAAKAGWGLTRVLSYQIGPDLWAGSLETVLDSFEPEPLPIHIVHAEGRSASAKVRAFIDMAVDRLRADPLLNG
jgi:DNA-binding transcriptional LysR family regulator